jgi:hypothetical protein
VDSNTELLQKRTKENNLKSSPNIRRFKFLFQSEKYNLATKAQKHKESLISNIG